ncbi:ankyrin repeat domain-containing protein [Pedobacter arcticus]|uniref:ankyrin repeat domain-containing protein n=1 Tax=Pedobacter arcticus TaxID=752140 RepID=UPI00030B1467|nr:ankyrin repeat domain-containing protein [Pedobacter arcticus]
MKKVIVIASFVFTLFSAKAQNNNTLLQADFWKQNPNVEAVKAEIAKGNNPAELDQRSMDPTTLAINNNAPLETIKFLLAQEGNPVNKTTHDSRIYLHWAAMRGNAVLVEYLIAKGSELRLQDSHATEPLVFSLSGGKKNIPVYEAFFKAGIDVKTKYRNGANLLLLSIANDSDLAVADYLIKKGLSFKDVDSDGYTVFDYAARSGNIDLLKNLRSKGVKPTDGALIFAAQGSRGSSSSVDVYKYLVEEVKLNPSVVSKSGNNVLHFIANKPNQEEIINYLLTKGVDVNKVNEDGNTPFMNASASKNLALLEVLSAKVKAINAVNQKGESALTMAVSASSPEVVAFLINKGANVKVEDNVGNNLAYYLVQSYRPTGRAKEGANKKDEFTAKMDLLTTNGLALNVLQKDGSSLYHIAVAKSDLVLLQKLADLKIDLNARNKEGLTALHRAALISKNDEVLKYLISIGADKGIKTEFDETAYDLATENEFLVKNNVSVNFLK